MDAPNQKITGAVPKSPSSNVSSTAAPSNVSNASSESKSPTMPGKVPGAASKSFPLQFGSISPGFMNGMQITARTGSAPPNLDEQKKDQGTVKSPVVSHVEEEPLPPSGSLSVGKAEASNVVTRDAPRGKKKKKELYIKAKAADTSSDLYMAYMGSEKKKEIVTASEGSENSSSIIEKQTSAEVSQENAAVCDKPVKSDVPRGKKKKKELYRKAKDAGTSSDLYKGPEEKKEIVTPEEEPDGWEDATEVSTPQLGSEVSTPQLGTSRNENQDNDDGNGLRTKRYSRDSPLKFVGQCPDLPEGFEITSFLADTLVVSRVNISRESYSCSGHNIEGPEKKKEIVTTSEGSENSSCIIEKQTSAEVSRENAAVCEKIVKSAVRRRRRGKKKRKELYRKVEAAGTSLDLYMAYKGPEEKKEIVATAEVPDDWEDAAEVSTPQLGTSRNENQNNDDGYGLRTKSFKKYNSNAAVGQPSAGSWNVDSSDASAVRAVQNGAHQQQPHGVSNLSVTSASSNLKPMDAPNQKITLAVPKSPSSDVSSTAAPSNVSSASSESKAPTMPGKVPGDAYKSFPLQFESISPDYKPLQFGSISPGFMKGMQIPARTGSAPPNLDEQKKDQGTVKSPVVSHVEEEPLPSSGSLSVGKAEASNVVKRDAPRGKKKKKELYIKAKAADTSSDLYMAYMGSEKKKEIVTASEGSENSSSIIEKQTSAEVSHENAAVCDMPVKSDVPRGKKKKKELYRKAKDAGTSSDLYMAYKGPEEKKEIVTTAEEPDGWEDATEVSTPQLGSEVSTPQLGTSRNENQDNDDGNGLRTKRYSRDSLLKFVGQCPDLPEGFEITSFLADTLVVSRVNISRESYSCPGHNIEGPEKKKEIVTTSEGSENSSCIIEKQTSAEVPRENVAVCEKIVKSAVRSRRRGKKKRKELYRKVEAAGTSLDLYMAYKCPEEKKEIVTTAEVPDDWEDAAEVSTPQLGTSRNENQNNDDGYGLRTKSFKKYNSNAAVGQPSAGSWNVDSSDSSAVRAVQNGAHQQQPTHGVSNLSVTSASSNLKPMDAPNQKITLAVPKSPSSDVSSTAAPSNVSSASSESQAPTMPGKVPGDAYKSFPLQFESISPDYKPLQFGSISPDLMNGMQIHARTNSAPPNLVEQKKDQARYESLRTAPALPTPSIPNQHLPKKDAGILDQHNAGEAHLASKSKRDAKVSAAPPGTQAQKPLLHPNPGVPMQLPFHRPQVPVQFGGPNLQIQSQAMLGASLPMPIPMYLPLGNPPMQHSMFVPSVQPHHMQSQGMMLQGQSLNFSPQMGPQLSPQLGNMGMNITPQFPQQPPEKYGGSHKWSKFPRPLMPGRGDMWTDVGYMSNSVGFQPGQGGNYGVLRNPWGQTPGQYAEGILSGPMQSLGPRGGLQINNSDSDRWQRGTGFQKGLMPSPQTPMQVMHKAEKKYEVGKVTDEEETKQRQLKAILNKLTPQNFEKLFQQVKQVNIDNVITLCGVVSQIFDKALMMPTFCEMYANCCFHLAAYLPAVSVDNERITFKRLLLNKCQEEFERGEREEEEANEAEEKGEVKQPAEEREEKRLRARRRMLGNIRLIGELFKKRMLTERIMHECINKLLGQYQNPDEGNIEALCILMSIIGEMVDHPKAKEHMDAYYDVMAQLSNNMKLSSRVRFMLKDAINLRKNKWQLRRKVEGSKRIDPAWVILLVGVLLWILVLGNCVIHLSRTTE